jgi:putative ABC transport system substrate-binding protein
MYPYPVFVEAVGLMAYAIDLAEIFRKTADEIDQILRGTKPGDIPFYQPTTFALAINLKTARALGLTMQPLILALADEVIE